MPSSNTSSSAFGMISASTVPTSRGWISSPSRQMISVGAVTFRMSSRSRRGQSSMISRMARGTPTGWMSATGGRRVAGEVGETVAKLRGGAVPVATEAEPDLGSGDQRGELGQLATGVGQSVGQHGDRRSFAVHIHVQRDVVGDDL